MKLKTYSSLGLDFPLSVPETYEEFDTNAKRIGAALDEAINNVVYRGALAEFRDAFCEKLEEATGVERKVKDTGRKDKDGQPIVAYDETEGDYVRRVCAAQGVEIESFQGIANDVAATIVFDASARERKPAAPKKLAAKYLNTAKQVLSSGNFDKAQARFAKYGVTWPAFSGDAEKDAVTLGWAIKAVQEAAEKAAMDELV